MSSPTGKFYGDLIQFIAIECELQHAGPNAVLWMYEGWLYLTEVQAAGKPLTHQVVKKLGNLVEPNANRSLSGYRQHNVRVGDSVKPHWEDVTGLMKQLLAAQHTLAPEVWFHNFEEVHPFADGNGRTGQLLYNFLRGTLFDMDWAPDFWDDYRRQPGMGAPRTAPTRRRRHP